MRLGLVGLGRMGEPVAVNLLAAGHALTVFDIDPDKCRRLADRGASVGADPADVAAASDASFSLVMTDAVLRTVALGPDGVLAGAAAGHVFCDLSTVSPAVSAEVAQHCATAGVEYLRAKVVGSVQRAVDAQLTVLASGDRAVFDRLEPVFRVIGDDAVFVGAGESAHYLKLVHSIVVGVYAALIGEALAFGEKGGADLEQMVSILSNGPLASTQLTLKAPTVIARSFTDPPSDIDTAAKDLDLALDAARSNGVPMPLTAAVRQVMSAMQANGWGRVDIWGILEAFEAGAGLRR